MGIRICTAAHAHTRRTAHAHGTRTRHTHTHVVNHLVRAAEQREGRPYAVLLIANEALEDLDDARAGAVGEEHVLHVARESVPLADELGHVPSHGPLAPAVAVRAWHPPSPSPTPTRTRNRFRVCAVSCVRVWLLPSPPGMSWRMDLARAMASFGNSRSASALSSSAGYSSRDST